MQGNARHAHSKELRKHFLNLAQIWTKAAAKKREHAKIPELIVNKAS